MEWIMTINATNNQNKTVILGIGVSSATILGVCLYLFSKNTAPKGFSGVKQMCEMTKIPPSEKVKNFKKLQSKQLSQFKKWEKENLWHKFHQTHYDWWTFPSDRSSHKHGDKFKLSYPEIKSLAQDKDFMKKYTDSVDLVAKSWGWNRAEEKPLVKKHHYQKWNKKDVRLGKMIHSSLLLNDTGIFSSLQKFIKKIGTKNIANWVVKLAKLK